MVWVIARRAAAERQPLTASPLHQEHTQVLQRSNTMLGRRRSTITTTHTASPIPTTSPRRIGLSLQ